MSNYMHTYSKVISEIKNGDNSEAYRILSAEEERELVENLKHDRQKLVNELVNRNLTLVVPFVKKYELSLDADDVFNEGVLGIMDAANRFDVMSKTKFSTYAYYYIRKYVNRLLHKSQRQFDTSANLSVISINGDHDTDSSESNYFESLIQDHDTPEKYASENSDESFMKKLIQEMVDNDTINTNEFYVVDELYFKNKSHREISEDMGITTTMVGNHRKNALSKMKMYLVSRKQIKNIGDLYV